MTKGFYSKLIATCLVVFLGSFSVKAQTVATYGFTQSTGTYTPLSGGTVVAKSSPGTTGSFTQDDNSFLVALPFTFNYNGTTNTSITINTNGWIAFNSTLVSNTYTAISNTTSANGFVGAFSRDLIGYIRTTASAVSSNDTLFNPAQIAGITVGDTLIGTGIPTNTTVLAVGSNFVKLSAAATSTTTNSSYTFSGSTIKTQVLGISPNRTFVIEWARWNIYGASNTALNFQIQLKEGGGVASAQTIDIIYGSNVTASTGSAQVGLRGLTNSDYNNRTSTTSWTTTSAGTANSSTISYSSSIVPPSGLTFTYTPPAACTGTPSTGTITSSSTSGCTNLPVTLSATGQTTGAGLIYQWQRRDSGSTVAFANIAGATTIPYVAVNQTIGTEYRLLVTCTPSTLSATSNAVVVAQTPLNQCYCTPGTTSTTYFIDNFVTTGATTNISNLSSGYSTGGYGNFTAQTLTVNQTATVNFTTVMNSSTSTYGFAVFIDYNQNGSFADAGEVAFNTTNYSTNPSGSFTIPASSMGGNTRMRIVGSFIPGNPSTNYCTGITSGEYEDYTINIVPLPNCSGAPSAGTAFANTVNACPNTPIVLNDSLYTVATGISYQWQSRPGGTATAFTDIAGATTIPFTIANQTAATDYRLAVVCSLSTTTTNSNVVAVGQNAFTACYCIPTNGNCTSEWVDSVTFGGLSNLGTGCTTGGYADYRSTAALTTTITQGGNFPITLVPRINAANSEIGVWIDFNGNGLFEASEYTLVGSGPATGFTNLSQSFTASISVPATAVLGVTGMRIMAKNGAISATGACSTSLFGEIEDYVVTIAAGTGCTGTPGIATATASDTGICAGSSFTLAATGLPTATGISYQWQSRAAGTTNTFASILGATTVPYTVSTQTTSSEYRLLVTCTASTMTSTSSTVTVNINPFIACYCIPATTGCTSSDVINNVTISSINNASGCGTNGYTDYSSTVTAGTLTQGSTAPIAVTVGNGGTEYVAVWIDYDHSGTFDASEFTALGSGNGTTISNNIAIPASALLGNTKMRVRLRYNTALTATDVCNGYSFGETEDYLVNIAVSTACSGTPPVAVATASTTLACPATPFTISATNTPALSVSGITYQWQSAPAPAGAFTNIAGATSNSFTVTNQTTSTLYRLIVRCATGPDSTFSNNVTVGQNVAINCTCTSTATSTADEDIFNVTFGTLNRSSTCDSIGTGPGSVKNQYSNYKDTANVGQVPVNSPTTLSVQIGTCGSGSYSNVVAVYIDLNRNGLFTDAGENIYVSASAASGAHTETASITIPAATTLGITTMRVVNSETFSPSNLSPCGTYSWGETEDYLINLTAAPSCTAPVVKATTTITSAGAVANWSPATPLPGVGYRYEVRSSGTGGSGATGRAATGTTTDTMVSVTGLASATNYTVYVRSLCSASDSSLYSSGGVFTTLCAPFSLPFTENFVSYPPNICWTEATGQLRDTSNLVGTSSDWGEGDYLNGSSTNKAANINIYGSSTQQEWMISPTINLGTSNYNVLEFNYGIVPYFSTSASTLDQNDTVAVVVSADNGTTWKKANAIKIFTIADTPSGANGAQRYYIPMRGYTGNVKIGWYATNASASGSPSRDNDIFIDSIKVSTCTPPVVNLGTDTALCAGNSITLTSAIGTSYLYSNNATTRSITVSAPGTYFVKTTNGNDGCFATDTIVITAAPQPVVNLGPDTAICAGSSIVFNAGNAGSTYLWSTSATTQSITASTAGSYSVRVTNVQGCVGRDTVVLSVNPKPIVNLGPDTAICAGSSIVFNAGNTGSTYLWSTSDTTQSITASTAGNYSVRVTNAQGCVGRDTVVLSVNPNPVVNLGPDTAICAGNAVTFNAGNTGATYLWSTNATTQSITASNSGSYSVRVTNASGCIGRDTVALTVNANPVVNLGSDSSICSGTTLTLDAGNTGATYLWSTSDTTRTIAVTTSGTYSVRVTNASGCISSDTAVITVLPQPVVNLGGNKTICGTQTVTLDAGNPGATYAWSTGATTMTIVVSTPGTYSVAVSNGAGCIGRDTVVISAAPLPVAGTINVTGSSPTFNFVANGAANYTRYVWYFGDGDSTTTSLSPSHTFRANGIYEVIFGVVNTCGADTAVRMVTVTGVGVNNLFTDLDVKMYPNPASTKVVIEAEADNNLIEIQVISATGALVMKALPLTNRAEINTSELANGIYNVRINTEQGLVIRRLNIQN